MYKEILKYTEEYYDRLIDLTIRLIQTPSESGKEQDLSLLIEKELKLLNYDEVFIDEIGNVIGIIKGDGSSNNILYYSHLDHHSPGNIEDWYFPPYKGIIENDFIHGCGASNCKAAIASQIYAGAIIKEKKIPIKGDYIFASVVQKNLSECFGIKFLFENTFKDNIKIGLVVLGNSTDLNIYLGHRGRIELEVTTYGRTSISSTPWLGINAIYKMIPVINEIQKLSQNLPSHYFLEKSSIDITEIKSYPNKENVLPDRCTIFIDRRFLPTESLDEVIGQIQSIINRISSIDPDFKCMVNIRTCKEKSYKGIERNLPKLMLPFLTDKNHPLVKKVEMALQNINNEKSNFNVWYFPTDGGYTSSFLNIPTIGYSPGEEKYDFTPFDRVNISKLKKSLNGYIAIHYNVS